MKLHWQHRVTMVLVSLVVSLRPNSAFVNRHLPEAQTKSSRRSRAFGTRRREVSLHSTAAAPAEKQPQEAVPLYRAEGIFAVEKPLDWTSNDVVSYLRGILERDARERGAKPRKVGSRRNKKGIVKVGHGGTLDPLATGVLVVGVGSGTKDLQKYLSGSKAYRATGELGFETTTLDMEGNVTKTGPVDHVTVEQIESVIPSFLGKTMQVPPIFSAIRKGGKKLYDSAREGASAEDMEIEAREVEIIRLELINQDTVQLPKFDIEMECGGGTFVRSLIRDIGYKLETVATTTRLERIKQGQFTLEHCLARNDWNADNIYAEIEKMRPMIQATQE